MDRYMRILIDGDACPNKEEIIEIAKKYNCEVILFIDYAHENTLEGCKVVYCEVGSDSVDFQIMKTVKNMDIVITQDYGLASLVLPKKANVLHVSGKIINEENIQTLLMTRYISAKQRKSGVRTKGPAKRTKEDKQNLLNHLEKLIKDVQK
ncbi:MAG: YaiI/YqxD family protein [Coprobacillaceae bacterium]